MSGMPSIQPTGHHPAPSAQGPHGYGGAALAAAGVSDSVSSMSSSSISTSMTVTNQVSAMLGQIDPALANHDLLKLALTLLILQTLMGNGKQGGGQDALAGLLSMGGMSKGNSSGLMMASSSSLMSFEASSVQSTSASLDAYALAATQSGGAPGSAPGNPRGHLNFSA